MALDGATLLDASGGRCGPAEAGTRVPCPPRRERDDEGYERWLAYATERADPFMAFLGIVFAMIVAFDLAGPGLSPGWDRALSAASWAIWAIFLIDFVARLVAAPSTTRFLRRHWLAVLMLAVPALRVLRLGALLRLGRALPAARVVSSSYRASGVARGLLGSRSGYLAGVAGIVTLAVAQLGWLLERDEQTFEGFGDALLWAGSVVIAMQGDPVPATAAGRVVMLLGFATGLVLIASLAGTVGAYLLEGRRERELDGGG